MAVAFTNFAKMDFSGGQGGRGGAGAEGGQAKGGKGGTGAGGAASLIFGLWYDRSGLGVMVPGILIGAAVAPLTRYARSSAFWGIQTP